MAFSSQDLLEREFGQDAVVSWSDHEESGNVVSDVVDDALEYADQEILFGLNGIYAEAELATSALVKHWATILTGLKLFGNRANTPPEWLVKEAESIRAMMKQVCDGLRTIPGLTPLGALVPTMSNRVIDRRYTERTVRVQNQTSSIPRSSDLGRDFFDSTGPIGVDP